MVRFAACMNQKLEDEIMERPQEPLFAEAFWAFSMPQRPVFRGLPALAAHLRPGRRSRGPLLGA